LIYNIIFFFFFLKQKHKQIIQNPKTLKNYLHFFYVRKLQKTNTL
jgi:hypothetical protein